MNTLTPKIALLKDIQLDYNKSIKSVETVHRECQHLLYCVESQLALRSQEKRRLLTNVGVNIRELLLQSLKGLKMKVTDAIYKIYSESNRYGDIYSDMIEQYQALEQTIKNSELSIDELQKIKKNEDYFTNVHEYRLIEQIDKENMDCQDKFAQKQLKRVKSWKYGEKKQVKEENNKDWQRVLSQSKERKEMMINQQRKYERTRISDVNTIIDSCLKSVSNLAFIKGKKKLNLEGIKVVQSFSKQSHPEATNNLSHGISLGLQSINSEEINLLCNEEFDCFNSKPSSLQRITEREEEYSNSSSNPSPLKKLRELKE